MQAGLKSRSKMNWVTTKSIKFNERVKEMKKILIRLSLAVVIIVFMTSAAYSELLVYEPFNYPVSELVGNSGAFGIEASGWEDWEQTEPAQVVQGSLLHPVYGYDLDFIGNHAEIVSGEVAAFFLTSLPDDGRDYWISFLYQTVDPASMGRFPFLFPDASGDPALGIEINGGGPGMYSDFDPWKSVSGVEDSSAVLWIVIKAETSGSLSTSEMGYMWVDPEPWKEPDIAEAGGALEYTIQKSDVTDAFYMYGSGDPAGFKIDEIKIGTSFEDVSVIPRCEKASNPSPENGEPYADVGLTELAWDAPTCVDGPTYNVYFNTDPNLVSPIAEGITETTCPLPEPLPLGYETIYYWRVDVIDPNEGEPIIHEGRIWHFTTWAKNPTITTQPASTTVPAGSNVQFAVEAVNTTGYQWYYSETSDGAGDPITGATSATYTRSGVLEADEGYFYCVASNSDGTTESDRARLLIERPLAHWKFEDNLDDLIDPLNNGTAIGYIDYVTGIDGKAVDMVDPNCLITTTNNLGELMEISVSMWIKPNALVDEQALLAANGTWDSGTLYIYTAEDWIYGVVIEDEEEETNIPVGAAQITEGEWNYCVFVYDTSTESSALYLNGELVDENVDADIASVAPILPPLSIGGISAEDGLPYSGLIDDLRIYNYRLSDLEIASLYTEIMTEADVCIGNPDYDLSENCVVDLDDLELLVLGWLECNIVPTCVQ